MYSSTIRQMLCGVVMCLLCGFSVGCASLSGPTAMLSEPTLEYDKYKAQWVLMGAKYRPDSLWGSALKRVDTYVWMRGMVDEAGQHPTIQLYVDSSGEAAGGLVVTSASDSTGTPLTTHRLENSFVQHTILGAAIRPKEVFIVDLPRPFLDARRAKGLDIRMNGYNNGSMTVLVTAAYLTDFLDRFDAMVAQKKATKG